MTSKPSRLVLLVVVALLLGALSFGCGGGDATDSGRNAQKDRAATDDGTFSGGQASPPEPAPSLALTDSLGKPFDLRDSRGKVVLVTFIYTHCPDVCPLIVSHLKTAQAQLGAKARDLQIVAVSTDPRGDSAKSVNAFLEAHGMSGKMRYLIGSRPQLERVWKAWSIVTKTDPKNPEFVEHSALVYGIGPSGDITTLYPPNFGTSQIVHDVPILATH